LYVRAVGELDFWLGEWDVRWDGGSGTNTITAELDGHVLVERFESPDLRGLSVSVHTDCWRQTWVDSRGSYLAFTGGIEDGAMTFRNETHRMRFADVERDRLTWLWERKESDGWKLLWRIEYARRA
jgi:hypothetical protein